MLPKEGQIAHRHFRALRHFATQQYGGSGVLALTVLHVWQEKSFPALTLLDTCPNPALSKEPGVVRFAHWLASLDTLTGAYCLSLAYALWVGKEVREREALFFTPPILSTRLIDDLLDNGASLTKHIWFDPASGGAAFIAPVAKRMAEALQSEGTSAKAILQHVSTHVLGNDVDPYLASMSKQFLRMVLYPQIAKTKHEPGFCVTTTNALTALGDYHGKVDVVICNPPYRKMKSGEVECYRGDYEAVLSGQPNLYALFFRLSLDCLRPSGMAGLLTPTSYLTGQSFSKLRAHILERSDVCQLDTIPGMGAFFGVEQETAIAVIRKKLQPPQKEGASACHAFRYAKDGGFIALGSCHLPKTGAAWPVPRSEGDVGLLSAFSASPFRLADYGYKAQIGLFVWNRDNRKAYSKLPGRRSSSIFPLVWSSDVLGDNEFEHGRGLAGKDSGKYVNMGRADAAGIVRQPSVVLQRVTSSDQPRRLVGSPIPHELLETFGGFVGENHTLLLVQTSPHAAIEPGTLAKVLRSKAIDRIFRCISGAVNVSIYELGHLPMPDPEKLTEALKHCASIDDAVFDAFNATCGIEKGNG